MILIAQITDLHLRPRGLTALGRVETNTLARRAVDALLALAPRPDAVVVTGDVGDTGDPREYEFAREVLGQLPMLVYVMAGNHDDPDALAAAFADQPWIAGAASADGLQYAVDVGPVRLVCLDTSVPGAGHGRLGPERLAFVEAALADAAGRPTILALHHPPAATGLPGMDAIGLQDGRALAAIVARHPHVGLVIGGHVHRSIVTAFAGTILALAPSVAHQVALSLAVSPATLIMEPPAFLLHLWTPEGGFVTHTAYVERFPGPYDFSRAEGVYWPGY